MQHELKILPQYFKEVVNGNKTFEIRKNDRGFKVRDTLLLKEWYQGDTDYKDDIYTPPHYTNNEITKEISYILEGGQHGLEEGYCITSLKDEQKEELIKLLEKAVEELENIYGKDTDLTIEIRKQLNESEDK